MRIATNRYILQRESVLDAHYVYLGEAQLSQMGHLAGEEPERGAKFWLCNKMSCAVWLYLGGYPDWLVNGPFGTRRMSKGDAAELLRIIDEHSRTTIFIELNRYEGDRLRVRMNSERGWLLYYQPGGGQLRSLRPLVQRTIEEKRILWD